MNENNFSEKVNYKIFYSKVKANGFILFPQL